MRSRVTTVLLFFIAVSGFANYREFTDIPVDPGLETRIRTAAERSLQLLPKLKSDDLAISVIDLTNPVLLARADYNGNSSFYPASVIKLFFMADIFMLHKESMPDVPRALKEMIVQSDNDATAYLVDIEASTTGGPELQGWRLRRYIDKRRMINNRFKELGYDISAMMKPWSFGPFGRDRQVLGKDRVNRNRLSANATGALLLAIARRRAVSPQASDAMMTLLQRPLNPPREDENQVKEFMGEALPEGTKLWSKAGWTSEVRHDAGYVELPNGRKLVVVIFTRGQAGDTTIIPVIAKCLFTELP